MSRRLGLRLVPTRMADDVAEGLTDGDAEQVPDEDLCDEPVGNDPRRREGPGSAAGLGRAPGGDALPVTIRRGLTRGARAVPVNRQVRDRR